MSEATSNKKVKRVPTMADTATAFEPRKLAQNPKQFGKSSATLVSAPHVVATDTKFMAANFQHLVCNALREALLSSGRTIDDFAAELRDTVPGMGSDRLGRVLRGESQIQIPDIVAWSQRFPRVLQLVLHRRTWGLHKPDDDF